MPAAAQDDAKTMIAQTSPEAIKALMAAKRPAGAPGSGLQPPPPGSVLRKTNPGNLPPKPSPPSRSNQLAAAPVPPPSDRNMPAAAPTPSPSSGSARSGLSPNAPPVRATGPGARAPASRAPHTMKGVAPAPAANAVPAINAPEDEQNAKTGRIEIGSEEEQELTERRDIVSIAEDGLADAEAALEAMTHIQNAEEALARGDFRGGESYAKQATKGDPSEQSYAVVLAFAQAQTGAMPIDDAIRKISKVLIEDPANEKALFYRAKLLAKKNKLHEAINDFDELLSANPNHQAAKTEVQALRAKLPT